MKQYDGGSVRTFPYKQPELWDWKDIGKFGRSQEDWSQRVELAGKVFRIGHLGDFNDLMLLGTLSGVEMGLSLAGIPHQRGGVETAMQTLSKYSK